MEQELENNINSNLKNNNEIEIKQNNFLNNAIGEVANTAIDVGLRFVLPDLIENQIIEVKDTLFNEGLKEGINKAIEEGINLGKSVLGIFTGKFENISQMQNAIKKGGIIDGISNVIDNVVNKGENKGKLSNNIASLIRNGKNVILNNISSNIEGLIENQSIKVDKLEKYNNNWRVFYNNKDFNGMELEYKKIKNILKEIVPLENTINSAREIENIHNLIKNNGKNFNVSEYELELAKKI